MVDGRASACKLVSSKEELVLTKMRVIAKIQMTVSAKEIVSLILARAWSHQSIR